MIAPGPLKKHHQKMVYRMQERRFSLIERIAITLVMVSGAVFFLMVMSWVLS